MDSNTEVTDNRFTVCPPLATREFSHIKLCFGGAGGRIRTPDLLITNQLLYLLSYTSMCHLRRLIIVSDMIIFVNDFFEKSFGFQFLCKSRFKSSSPRCLRLSVSHMSRL